MLLTRETTVTSNSDLLDDSEHISAFWKAVGVGDVAEVQKVLDGGWVEEIDCVVVGRELKGDVGVDLEGHWGRSALMVASGRGYCDLVRFLLEKGAQVDFQDCYGKSALMLASECGQCEVARLLLDRGAEVGLRDCVNGKSALMIASECGQCEVVKLLLDAGAQVDLQDKVGRTAIVLASEHGQWKVGVLLLERMAGVDSATLSAIMSAVMVKCKSLLQEYLLEECLEPEFYFFEYINELIKRVFLTECYQEILWLACGCGKSKICQAFVAKCRWVELTPLWGRALILASAYGHCEIVALLLEKGFPQNLVNYGEYSALAMACACNGGHCEVVELLLGRGADVDAAIDGESVLVSALNHEHTEVGRLLLERGAQVQDCYWDPEVPRLPLDRGAEVGLRDCVNGKSALMIASECGQCEVVKLLLDTGAQVELQDKVGRTAIVLASEHEHWKVGMLFLKRMAVVDSATLSAIMSAVMVKCRLLLKQQYLVGHIDVLKYVEELSKRVFLTECYQEILWLVCWCGNFKLCQAFVAMCRWVELTPLWGRALFLASAYGHCEIVALLLEKGFPQDLVHYGEYSALAMACACNGGHCEVVELLLGRGADVDAVIDGESVLVSALNHEHTEVGRLLLERGAQVQDCYWDPEVPRLPLDRGAEVGLRDCVNGKSALMIASECGQCEVVKLLLDTGAQVELQDKVGRTAIVLASEHEHWKVGMLFLKRMAVVDSATLSAIMSAVMVKCRLLLKQQYLVGHIDVLKYVEELSKRVFLTECYQEILWLVCWCGNFKLCQAFVAMCRWVELTPLWGRALFLASAYGHCEIVALLLEKGFPQDLVHYGEYSALAMACACNGGHCEVVELLLGRGADVDAVIDGESVLVSALKHEHTEVVRPLLERGAKVDLWDPEVPRLLLDRGDEVGLRDCVNGKFALMIASECGQCEVVKLLLDAGAQVDLQDKVGRTAIVLASEHGHWKVGMLLLERMAGVDTATLSAIMSAVMVKCKLLLKQQYLGHIDFLKYVEELSKRVFLTECYKEILWLACGCGNFKICQAFVAKCRWVEPTPLWGKALFLASACGHCEIVALLLEKGFPQDLVHYGEYSALAMACACSGGHCEVVELLLGRGADVDAVIDGESVLVSALNHKHTEVGRLLLERGAQVQDCYWDPEVPRLPLGRGAEVGLRDCVNGKSALMIASECGQCEVVKLLLDTGAQVELQDKVGRTAIVLASEHEHWKVGMLFLKRMAVVDSATLSAIMSAVMVKCRLLLKQQYLVGHIDFLKYVEELSKRVFLTECYQEILWLVCWCGNFKLCQAFVAMCRWVELTPLWGRALFLASAYGHCEIVALLLEKGFPQDLVHYGEYSALAMACACNGGHCEVVELLLGRGADVDAVIDGESVLVSALKHEHTEVVRPLLERGAKVDLWDPEVPRLLLDRGDEVGLWDCVNGKFALMIASECGQCEVVKLLLDAGAQVDLQDKVGRTAIVLASEHGHWKVGMLLLERMAGVDTATLSAIMSAVMVKCKLLLKQQYLGHIDFLKYVEELSKRVFLTECYKEILWLACGCGNFKICQAFVAKCRWVELTPLWGKALFLASACGHCEIVALLLERGFPQDLVHYGEYSALAMVGACQKGHCEVVKLLLGRGADVNAATDFKHRENLDWLCIPLADLFFIPKLALVDAASRGHTEIVRLLLDKGARVGLHSAVTSAIREGFHEVVELFVERYADEELLDSDGCSPLMSAIKYDRYEMAEFLLEKVARANLQDNSGISPLMVSCMTKSQYPLSECSVADLLLERGAQIDLQDKDGMSALMFASRYGLFDMAKILLDKGAQIDLQDKSGRSALMIASEYQHWDVGKLLIERGAEVDTTILSAFLSSLMIEHQEPLNDILNATQIRYLKDINLLIEKGALIGTGTEKACKVLLWLACVSGDFYIAQLILETSPWVEESELWWRALYLACSHGHLEIVAMLLEKGFPQDLVHYGEYSAPSVVSACKRGHCEVVKLLLGKGADVDAVVDSGHCRKILDWPSEDVFSMPEFALVSAARGGHTEIVRLLLDKGARVGLHSAVTSAIREGFQEVVELFMECCAEKDLFDVDGCSPLMLATRHGHIDMAKWLLEKGAQVNLQDKSGRSAVTIASEYQHWDVGKLLIERGAEADSTILSLMHRMAFWKAIRDGHVADIKKVLETGKTDILNTLTSGSDLFNDADDEWDLVAHRGRFALTLASWEGHHDMVKFLLDNGAQVDSLDHYSKSALMVASECGRVEVARLLLDYGAEVDLRGLVNGKSALVVASEYGQCEVVKLLLDAGAQVDLQDKSGRSALMFASEYQHRDVGKLLMERGAEVDTTILSAHLGKFYSVVV